jgi:Rrf2 family cysteine metabolism transcriptional repressor
MRISNRGEYGLQALFDLAQHYRDGAVTSGSIAARQQIPEDYLNRLLIALRKAGLVRSVRGPQGGHVLARPPAQITLAEAVVALEGSLSPAKGLDARSTADEPLEVDVLRNVWREVEGAVSQVLTSITLDDLCQRKMARKQRIMYYI